MIGPLNSSEVIDDDTRLKLGSIWIPIHPGLDVSAELDPKNGKLISISLAIADTIANVELFAAAKDHDTWTDIRYEISAKLEQTQVVPKIVNGKFGPEIHAVLPSYDSAGKVSIQPVRFVGINGDRWFMRIAISGDGASKKKASDSIDDIISKLVVDRGDLALAPGEHLPIDFPLQNNIYPEGPNESIHIQI